MADTSGLIDLARTKADMKEEAKELSPGGDPDPYCWGLNIRLESEELDKLGITKLPEVGSEYHLMVVAKVTSVNQSATTQDDERCVGLTITMMQILMHESADEEAAEGKETPATEAAESKKPRKGGVMGY